MSGHKTGDTRAAFDRTEVLLRLLLATPPKPAQRKRRKTRPSGAKVASIIHTHEAL
jgi:hypothetical protein